MSNRSLTGVVRDCMRRASNILHITDKKQLGEYLYKECDQLGLISADWVREKIIKGLLELGTLKSPKKSTVNDDTAQLALFDDYHELRFDLCHSAGTEIKELGAFTIADIDQLSVQKRDNAAAVLESLAQWERAASIIRPVLLVNPTWTWRDAVEHLRGRGELPEL